MEYEQINMLKEYIRTEFEKQNMKVELLCRYRRYEEQRKFDVVINIDISDTIKSSFFVKYVKGKEVPFTIGHNIDSKIEVYLIEKMILETYTKEIYQQYKTIETVVSNWVKEQPSLRLICLFDKDWLKKQFAIAMIEAEWEKRKEERRWIMEKRGGSIERIV